MTSISRLKTTTLLVLVALAISTGADAQDEKKKNRKRGSRGFTTQVMARFKGMEFSKEQKAKLADITKKYSAQVAKIRKDSLGLLTAEQRLTRSKAIRAARQEGKKYAEAAAAANKKAGLSEELIGKLNEAQKKIQAIQKEMGASIESFLTEEQKASLKKKSGKKKKDTKKAEDKTTSVVQIKLPNMLCGGCERSVQVALQAEKIFGNLKTDVKNRSATFTITDPNIDFKKKLNEIAAVNKHVEGYEIQKKE